MNIIYIRTSTEEQQPQNQIKDCETLVKDYELIEDKQSAWKDTERAGFNRLTELIKQKKVNSLIVWDLDRLFRNRNKLIEFFGLCKIYKTKIYSFRQQWLEQLNNIPEPFNEIMHSLMLQIMGWLAQEESQKKSDRVKLAVRKKDGLTTSYKGNKWGRKALSTQKKNLIKELHTQGKTIRQIALELNISVGVVHKSLSQLNEEKSEQ